MPRAVTPRANASGRRWPRSRGPTTLLAVLLAALLATLQTACRSPGTDATTGPTSSPAELPAVPDPDASDHDGAGPAVTRLAFGSCARQDRPQPVWDGVLATDPDLFVLLGDNVYGDTEDMTVLASAYARLDAVPGFARLRAEVPLFATWDDHDYGVDDGGSEYPMKAASKQVLLAFLDTPPDAPRRSHAGVYDAQVFGPPDRRLQLLLLDTRTFRDPLVHQRDVGDDGRPGPYVPTTDTGATLLGAEQWRWLEGQLREPAALRVIASSIQVVSDEHGWESWSNFPHERERLRTLLAHTAAGPTVIVSGDRHFAEIALDATAPGGPLFDVTASSLNASASRWRPLEANRRRVAGMPWGDNFGLLVVDWDAAPPSLSLQVRDVRGDVVLRHDVPLAVLSRPAP